MESLDHIFNIFLRIASSGRPAMRATCFDDKNVGPPSAAAPSQMPAAFSAINIAARTASAVLPSVMMP